jgi:uracil phosphoribosyltransferase
MNLPKLDSFYDNVAFHLSEREHRYGKNIHLLSDPYLLTLLARLCSPRTVQPLVNEMIRAIYTALLNTVIAKEFPQVGGHEPTRMQAFHPEGIYQGSLIQPETSVVSVNLARAGTLPSHLCYDALNYLLNPALVRQDHISIARTTDSEAQVTGSEVTGHKIGGDVEGAILLFPDPMGATGGTLVKALDLYKKRGKPLKAIALHCIVTPEYIKKIQKTHPDLVVYAVRLDRGLSSEKVLDSVPGTYWDEEKGLNDKQYIVPGGGGFGEVMNNAYV